MSTVVDAPNWLAALGVGLDRLGEVGTIDRLACEVLVNGTVLARDARTGKGFVVRAEEAPAGPAPQEREVPEIRPPGDLDDGDDETTGEVMGLFLDDGFDGSGDDITDEVPRRSSGWDDDVTDPLDYPGVLPQEVPGLELVRNAEDGRAASNVALDLLVRSIPCEASSVLLTRKGGGLQFLLARGPSAGGLEGSILPRGAGIAAFCIERGAALILRNPNTDPHFYRDMDRLTGFDTRDLLCVPLAVQDIDLGCIELINAPAHRPFVPEDLQVAQQVAETLSNRLFRERVGL